MTQIHTRIRVGRDHRISGVAPPDVPPGEHEATINLAPAPARQLPTRKFNVDDLPKHDLTWDDSISLRREDMYGDDGR
ncbi:MAG TPA: hypothetical protein VMF86_07655 [Stellaceae bacterium]|nr:hypothetical protein [Stellaceae bacterium]